VERLQKPVFLVLKTGKSINLSSFLQKTEFFQFVKLLQIQFYEKFYYYDK